MHKTDLITDVQGTEQDPELIIRDMRENNVTLHVGQVDAAALCNATEGMMQMAEFVETSSRLATLHSLQRIKEAKTYKGVYVRSRKTGEFVTVKTWDEYCEAYGRSRAQIDADLKNLAVFGDNLIKIQDALGIGYRDLRLIRAGLLEMPLEERDAALSEISDLDDKVEAQAKLDDLTAKLAKTEHKIKELQAEVSSKETLMATHRDNRDKAELKLQKMLKIQEDEPDKLKRERDIQARKDITAQIHKSMGELLVLCNLCSNVLYEADYDLREYVNNQVHGLCEMLSGKLADIHLDVHFVAGWSAHGGPGAETDSHKQ